MARSRKAKREDKAERQTRGRSQQFYDAIEEAQGRKLREEKAAAGGGFGGGGGAMKESPPDDGARGPGGPAPPKGGDDSSNDGDDDGGRAARMEDAQQRMDMRPELSSLVVDEESGMQMVVQGRNVRDVVTQRAVKLSDMGPQYRLAQMFPGVPDDVRSKHRFRNWREIAVPDMVRMLNEACEVKLDEAGTARGIPPHPSVANRAVDFVLANRDLLGSRMNRALGRITMNAAWRGDRDEAVRLKRLWRHFTLLENHISAPLRQIVLDAEGRVGPNFGNLDLMSYCGGPLYERVANYLVLKGMVAHWEKKVVDADYIEKNPINDDNFFEVLVRGDPKRYLPDAPILYSLRDCTQVCAMAQQMCNQFVATEGLFGDFPPEIVFLEEALKVRGGTALRKYMIEEFCPERGITPEMLREGVRRLYQQLDNMPVDPYADLTNKVQDLAYAMAVGTDDAHDPYEPYLGMASLDKDSPAYFESYTFNSPKNSIIRFLDNQYASAGSGIESFIGPPPTAEEEAEANLGVGSRGGGDNPFDMMDALFKDMTGGDNPLGDFFSELAGGAGMGEKNLRSEPKPDRETVYRVPKERSMGRPHEVGWLEFLEVPENERYRLGEVPPGRIIPDDD